MSPVSLESKGLSQKSVTLGAAMGLPFDDRKSLANKPGDMAKIVSPAGYRYSPPARDQSVTLHQMMPTPDMVRPMKVMIG